jgi:hypothetical protein
MLFLKQFSEPAIGQEKLRKISTILGVIVLPLIVADFVINFETVTRLAVRSFSFIVLMITGSLSGGCAIASFFKNYMARIIILLTLGIINPAVFIISAQLVYAKGIEDTTIIAHKYMYISFFIGLISVLGWAISFIFLIIHIINKFRRKSS